MFGISFAWGSLLLGVFCWSLVFPTTKDWHQKGWTFCTVGKLRDWGGFLYCLWLVLLAKRQNKSNTYKYFTENIHDKTSNFYEPSHWFPFQNLRTHEKKLGVRAFNGRIWLAVMAYLLFDLAKAYEKAMKLELCEAWPGLSGTPAIILWMIPWFFVFPSACVALQNQNESKISLALCYA